jgi:formylmethanofuran--tetrahydromethanopterin N-formyltransferase
MRKLSNVIMPFPGGVVRSGSKVGSRYPTLSASTNDAFCPTLKGQVKSELAPNIGAVLEIVIDGLDEDSIKQATRAGILAACSLGKKKGIHRISAGNYGGDLGPFHFHLQEILS